MITPAWLRDLKRIVGPGDILTDPASLLCYAYDSQPKQYLPDVVVFPANTEETVKIVHLANNAGAPIVPRGAGTNLSGGSVPIQGGVVVCFTRFNQVKHINSANLSAVVEPGVITGRFQSQVEDIGLFYPPDPSSLNISTLGGNLAESAGGPRGFKYGTTKDYALGLQVVLSDGEVIRTGGATVKNVAGYDLTHLFVGSEGTLGIITEATLRLLPLPEHKQTMLAAFGHIEDAAAAVSAIVASGIIPVSLEFMDQVSVQRIETFRPSGLPVDAGAVLLIEVDGSMAEVQSQAGRLRQILEKGGVRGLRVASDSIEAEDIWAARRSAYAAIVRSAPTAITEDATVPRDQIPALVRRLQDLSVKYRINMAIVGHAGDGNLHPTVMTDERNVEEMHRVEAFFAEVFTIALELGGTLTGEHGVGFSKSLHMESQFGQAGLKAMRNIKMALDPRGLFNPGKMGL